MLISGFVGADAEFRSETPFLLKSDPLISQHKCLHAFLSTLFILLIVLMLQILKLTISNVDTEIRLDLACGKGRY